MFEVLSLRVRLVGGSEFKPSGRLEASPLQLDIKCPKPGTATVTDDPMSHPFIALPTCVSAFDEVDKMLGIG